VTWVPGLRHDRFGKNAGRTSKGCTLPNGFAPE
jgi:hypothetical protein